jgi:hypothetical protein
MPHRHFDLRAHRDTAAKRWRGRGAAKTVTATSGLATGFLLRSPTPNILPNGGQEIGMTSSELSPPPTERQPLDAGVLRASVLALIALIVGSMFTYELVRSTRRARRCHGRAPAARLRFSQGNCLPTLPATSRWFVCAGQVPPGQGLRAAGAPAGFLRAAAVVEPADCQMAGVVVSQPHGSQAPRRTNRADDAGEHAGERRSLARRLMPPMPPRGDHQRGTVAG